MSTSSLKGQILWGWKIAIYLFLAGVGAGAYFSAILLDNFVPQLKMVIQAGVILGPALVIIGTIFLIADLGKPSRFAKAGSNPKTSWISRGVVVLTVFIILGLIHVGLWIWPFNLLEQNAGARLALGGIGGAFAILTLIYTGLLLGANKSLTLWSNPILPLLFLISGGTTGVSSLALAEVFSGSATGASLLSRSHLALILVKALAIFLLLYGVRATTSGRASVSIITKGVLASRFWAGVIVTGLIVPLAVEGLALGGLAPAIVIAGGAILTLAGGLMLRHVIVAAGVKEPLKIAGFIVQQPVKLQT